MIILVVCPDKIVDTHDYIKIMEFTINSELHYSSTGTDGRPIIRKKTSVTDRHTQPVLLSSVALLSLFLTACSSMDAPRSRRRSYSIGNPC